jgi:hypothetical protein
MVSRYRNSLFAAAAICVANVSAAPAQTTELAPNAPTYASLADFALAAQVAAVVTVDRAVRLKGADAGDVAPGRARFYLTGTVDALLAGRGGLPGTVDWIADVPLTASNHGPKLKKRRLVLLARSTPGRPGTLQLVARDAALDWSPDVEARLRAILTEAVSPLAPPAVTGIGHAFHVAGTIPGEGETQIFLRTADARPVSLSVVRRPGEQPRWSESLGELVDDNAAAPKPETLAWYRLACGLPRALPDEAVADQPPEDARQARDDYRFILDGLGPCARPGGDDAAPAEDQSSR